MSTGRSWSRKRVEPVAHRVLHRELVPQQRHRRRVGRGPGPAAGPARRAAPAPGPAAGRPRRRRGVEHGPARQHQHQRLEGVVGVLGGAAGHPAGVVGHDTADGAGTLAGRVRPELASVAGPAAGSPAARWRPGPPAPARPPSSTSMPRKCRRVSARIPSLTACPDRLVPPDRKVSGTPWAALTANSRPTASASAGVATAAGVSRKCEASWAIPSRSVARMRTRVRSDGAAESPHHRVTQARHRAPSHVDRSVRPRPRRRL